MTTAGRTRLSPDAIRAELSQLGLREEIEPIPGYAFTQCKAPDHAVITYAETHGGAEATRFYIDRRTYILRA